MKKNKLLAWLEKQGSEPNWCHHKVDLSNCSEEYRKAYYDGWNNCNQQHSQCKSESNDVIKCLINGMKFYYEDNEEATWGTEKFSMKVKDILSWLEKQCEQKSADKVEPKFKVGDYLVNDYCKSKVIALTDDAYLLDTEQGIPFSYEHNAHLWTIADATEGDVLACNEEILLFKSYSVQGRISVYCWYNGQTNNFHSIEVDDALLNTRNKIYPATEEQHDFLFQKIHEAGYEWDEENKELKKIEQKPTNEPKFKIGDYIERKDGVGCHAKIIFVGGNFYGCEKLIYPEDESPFFEFMFENQDEFRVSSDFQQKPAWSEEDERNLNDAILFIETGTYSLDKDNLINWLKSLRPQNTWKPSDEQMVVLELASKYERVFTPKQIDILIGLKEQLKKLKEE